LAIPLFSEDNVTSTWHNEFEVMSYSMHIYKAIRLPVSWLPRSISGLSLEVERSEDAGSKAMGRGLAVRIVEGLLYKRICAVIII
jgi:hypothetical protein